MAEQKQNKETKSLSSIAAVEAVLDKYLDEYVAPIFNKKAAELEKKQNKEYDEIQKKWSRYPQIADPMASIRDMKKNGKWQSKGFDWVIEETGKELNSPKNKKIMEDLGNIQKAYARALCEYMGKKKYEELCKKYGTKFIEAKVNQIYRDKMEELMVKHKVPKSAIEHILKTTIDNSFLGLFVKPSLPEQSDTDKKIADKAYEAYDASWLTKATGHGASILLDTALMGGRNPFSFIKWDTGLRVLGYAGGEFINSSNKEIPAIEVLDKDIYGKENSKDDIKKASSAADSVNEQKIINLGLSNKVKQKYSPSAAKLMQKNIESFNDPDRIFGIIKELGIKVQKRDIPAHIKEKDVKENYRLACYFAANLVEMKRTNTKSIKFGDTTLTEKQVAQRARDYAYYANEQLEMAKKMERAKELEEQSKNEISEFVTDPDGEVRMVTYSRDSKRGQELAAAENSQSMVQEQMQNGFGGWSSLLGWGGGELPNSLKNFSEVFSTLPDMIVGMFTGKNKHLKLSECFFPLAAIMGGLLFKNPLIRILLLLTGSMMLFQKAKQNMGLEEGQSVSRTYKKIPDEPLNSRIKDPVMKGNTLVASIDDRPYVITVSDQAVDAYYKGYIPINALSNKVLEVFDRQEGELQSAYSQNVANTEEQQRTRGIK
ncbi:MAG: hypothetical protein ACI3ZD_09220 [Prevotella sp.]